MKGYREDYHLEERFRRFRDVKDLISTSAEIYSDRVAFVLKEKDKETKEVRYQDISYPEFYNEINALGTAMSEMGYVEERVAVIGENSYKWIVAALTSACGKSVTIPIDKMLKKEEIESCLRRSRAKVVFCDRKKKNEIREILNKGETSLEKIIAIDFEPEEGELSVDKLIKKGKELLKQGDRTYLEMERDPDEMSFLLFTSGTTSESKAVMLSQKNLMTCVYGMNIEEVFFPTDVNILIVPLNHCFGFTGLLTFLSEGIKNVFCDGLKYIGKNIREYKVSVLMGVPLLLEGICKKVRKSLIKQGLETKFKRGMRAAKLAEFAGLDIRRLLFKSIIDELGGNLRFIVSGAAPLDPAVAKFFNGIGILTVQGYGLTETSPAVTSESYRYLKPGTVGKPAWGVEVKIVDPDEDGIGELAVRGDNVMLGYYENKEATDEVLRDGWFYTGDFAKIDKEGYVYISGRKKNVIVMKNGKNVFPEEIENQINNLPYIDESMVFTKQKLSDVVIWAKAVYNMKYLDENHMTVEELKEKFKSDIEKINDQLPAYKMIRSNFLSRIPIVRTTTKKIKRKEEIKSIMEELDSVDDKIDDGRE